MRPEIADRRTCQLVEVVGASRPSVSKQRGVSSAYDALMRSLLFPQAPGTGMQDPAMIPRLLNLIVPESAEFFHRLPAEIGHAARDYCR
jgi:hypothetical protein